MRQIPLSIGCESLRSFDSFVVGANALALAHVRTLTQSSAPIYLWGSSGAGKTHLLQALANQVQQQGGRVSWFSSSVMSPWHFDERSALIVFDQCDSLNDSQQYAAFRLFVEATTHGVLVVAAGRMPPVDLQLRDDLRSRLGWGHVFFLEPLAESEACIVLRREAVQRGLSLSDDVLDYLLTHFSRDLKFLMALLERLDEFSLAHKRAVTVPLLKQMLTEEGA